MIIYLVFLQSPKKVGDDIAKATGDWKGLRITVPQLGTQLWENVAILGRPLSCFLALGGVRLQMASFLSWGGLL